MNKEFRLTFICNVLLLLILIIYSNFVYGYKMENGKEVHQHITNESQVVWSLIPYEIKQHLKNPINTNTNTHSSVRQDYDIGDDITTGSAEEDILARPLTHFWEADNPEGGIYQDGLGAQTSSYLRARSYFKTKVIPLYLKGDIDEAYYWLGRVAHLLEDATVPAHVHLDEHPIFDSLEDYTGANFSFYNGSMYAGRQYYYESLPNLESFNWNNVDARTDYKQYIELFRLFWFAAQRAQYFASNDEPGNDSYVTNAGGNSVFSPSLWENENVTLINQTGQVSDNVNYISDAEVPHAMKAVAGLYRLFWEYAHTDWPTFHHDNRRTGFTILKGDMTSLSRVNRLNLVLDSNVGQDHISRASVADIDNDGKQDVVIAASKLGSSVHDGDIFDSELTWGREV